MHQLVFIQRKQHEISIHRKKSIDTPRNVLNITDCTAAEHAAIAARTRVICSFCELKTAKK